MEDYRNKVNISLCLVLPLSYIEFAQEESHLFKLLFVNDMDLDMTEAKDIYKEKDNEQRAEEFSETIGIELEKAKAIFLDLFLYTHGVAVLTATKKLTLDRESAVKMVVNILSLFIREERPDWDIYS